MRIETKRLMLRPFVMEDACDLFEYLEKPTVHCFFDMKVNTIEDAKKAVAQRMNDGNGLYFAIVLKENGKVIGEIFSEPEATDPTEVVNDTYSPCWILNPVYQGKGYAFEAVTAYYNLLFSKKGARRVYIFTEDYNIACQKLCEKLGMRKEGLFQEFVSFINDEEGNPIYENTYQYALLKKEWNQK